MAVDLGKMDSEREEKEKKNKKGKKQGNSLVIEKDSVKWLLIVWPHASMIGVPWVKRMYHRREVPQGAKGDWNIVCQRSDWSEDAYSCPGCKQNSKYKKLAFEEWERQGKPKEGNNRVLNKWDKEAKIYEPSAKKIAQVLDITAMFGKDDPRFARQMKPCFLRYGEEGIAKDCEDCYLASSCEVGVQKWYFGSVVHSELLQHFKDYKDITDPEKMIAVRVTRIGEGLYTRYKTAIFPENSLKFGAKLIARIEKQIDDLTLLDIAPKADTPEALVDIYRSFFTFKDVGDNGGDIIPDDEMLGGSAPRVTSQPAAKSDVSDDKIRDVRERMAGLSETGKMNRGSVSEVIDDDDSPATDSFAD